MDAWTLIIDIAQRDLPPVDDETPLQNIGGWDSLKVVELVLRLENQFNRELSESEIESLATVGDVKALFKARQGEAAC